MGTESYYIPTGNRKMNTREYSYETEKLSRERKYNEYLAFTEDTKVYLLSEALGKILTECLDGESANFVNYGKSLCEHFVREEGYDNLMRRFRSSTQFLAEMEICVREACCGIIGKVDKTNSLTFTIQNNDQNKFFDSLKGLPIDRVSKKITERVCDAAEEFIQRNVDAKLDIEELAAKTKERIDAAKEKKNDELAEKIQQEQMTMYKRGVEQIKNRPTQNIYEHMMNKVSKCVLENGDLKDNYLNESGQFDLSIVEEQVRVMYTFLEMVNSLKIKNVTNKYIEECLSSIQ